MIYTIRGFQEFAIAASDGSLGSVTDVYFDDQEWIVRYFVVETGSWLKGRRVLLSAARLTVFPSAEWLTIDATREQVRNSPAVETELPVSRQCEQAIYDHFGWPYYWGEASLADGGAAPGVVEAASVRTGQTRDNRAADVNSSANDQERRREQDPHLRSARELRGYALSARDGEIGHIEDFLVDGETWQVRAVAADTRKWLSGRTVLIPIKARTALRWCEANVVIDLTRDEIKSSSGFEAGEPLAADSAERMLWHRESGWRK
jgi:uncharacterized protein YrrD